MYRVHTSLKYYIASQRIFEKGMQQLLHFSFGEIEYWIVVFL